MNLNDAAKLFTENMRVTGLNDITKESWERQLIDQFKDEFLGYVKTKANQGSMFDMGFKPTQYILTPKNRYVFDYRKTALIDPSCLAKYGTLVLMAAEHIEKERIPVSDNVIFSGRFKPSGHEIFNKDVNYNLWKEQIKERANDSKCSYVVHCDIASFYDRINIHRVESTMLSIGVDRHLVKKINDLLLFWSKKDSYGIPVGNVPSRVLAEAALIDIDRYLVNEKVNFVRYVDDYRLFSPDIVTAQRWMNKLTTRLFRDGLMLNTGKTRIVMAKKDDDAPAEMKEDEATAVVKMITKLTGGYNKIAKVFYMPSEDRFDAFKKIKIKDELSSIDSHGIVEFQSIQKLIISCIIQRDFESLYNISHVCRKYLYSLDYFTDMLIKNSSVIPGPVRDRIADEFSALVMGSEFYSLEWHEATIATLLSHASYLRKDALIHILKSGTKEVCAYPAMIALEGLFDKVTRTEFRTIREWYDRCDDWEKRRVNHLSKALPDEERKAWGKAVKSSISHDFLSHRYIDSII